ncbi:hypothetical protein SORBI_3003G172850 [Sorghum bicolor]|uniref:DNA-directed RNA polymerase n=1 Tax=Sorghum bicolor TaxID=4558 RepID=A0A1W0VXS5_SORBI|nr:hypothetical protein SORBI_3003G172850 [Sorghum bicolor]
MTYAFCYHFQLEDPLIQLKEDSKWIDVFDFHWRLGIDGLSLGSILLTGFITTLATLAAWPVTRNSQLFYFLMLAMYSGQIGLFSSRDLLLFFIMWELELIPVYLLLSMWGGKRRLYSAVYESLTYSSELYVSARLIFGFDVQKQTISIGNIPIMNSLGTFIINGIYRIVINQILLSPGIYYRSELDHKGISIYTGTIISDWGGRSELAIDKKERIWARVSRKQKISILVLSSAMGSNLREILDNVCYHEIFLSFPNAKEKKRIESKEKAILEFYQQFACVGGDLVFSESLCEELQKKFFQQKCELGRVGRRNMNRRLNLDIPQNNTFLLPRDVLAATDHLIGMKFGTGILDDDDMNHLKNKRIRSVADLLQDQFGLALGLLQHAVQKTIRRVFIRQSKPTPQTLVTPTSTSILLITTYETFFGTYP